MKTLYKFSYGDWYEAPDYPIQSVGHLTYESACVAIRKLKEDGWDGFSEIFEYYEFPEENSPQSLNVDKVNRIEIIGKHGRSYVQYFKSATYSIQDDGRTLKVFIDEECKLAVPNLNI